MRREAPGGPTTHVIDPSGDILRCAVSLPTAGGFPARSLPRSDRERRPSSSTFPSGPIAEYRPKPSAGLAGSCLRNHGDRGGESRTPSPPEDGVSAEGLGR